MVRELKSYSRLPAAFHTYSLKLISSHPKKAAAREQQIGAQNTYNAHQLSMVYYFKSRAICSNTRINFKSAGVRNTD